MTSFPFEGSTALVTGATAGIGRAIAEQLGEHGATVLVHGCNPERGAEVTKAIESAGGLARFLGADLSDADDVRQLAEQAGAVDILVNNAGIYEFALTPDSDDAFFDRHFHLNVRAPHILVGALVPGMVERGRGVVVNVSSAVGSHPGIEAGIYGASKAALELLTKAWADEFGSKGVRVNAAVSGPSKTPGTSELTEFIEGLGRTTALRRAADPAEIAQAVVFLASAAASYVNGAVLHVDGGELALRPQ